METEVRRYAPHEYGMRLAFVIPIDFKLISKSNSKAKYLEAKYKNFEEAIAWLAVIHCKRPRFKGGWVVLRPHFKTHSHNDLNNCFKSLCDGLIKGDVYEDDKDIPVSVVPAEYGDLKSTVEIWALPEPEEKNGKDG